MTISQLEHQLTEREWSEGTALLRAQLELKWRSHLAREIAGRETAAQAALEHAGGESGTALIATEGR
jgi:hypothetical protein